MDWAALGELKDDLKGFKAEFGRQTYAMEDAWTGRAAGTTASPWVVALAPRDTAVVVLTPR